MGVFGEHYDVLHGLDLLPTAHLHRIPFLGPRLLLRCALPGPRQRLRQRRPLRRVDVAVDLVRLERHYEHRQVPFFQHFRRYDINTLQVDNLVRRSQSSLKIHLHGSSGDIKGGFRGPGLEGPEVVIDEGVDEVRDDEFTEVSEERVVVEVRLDLLHESDHLGRLSFVQESPAEKASDRAQGGDHRVLRLRISLLHRPPDLLQSTPRQRALHP